MFRRTAHFRWWPTGCAVRLLPGQFNSTTAPQGASPSTRPLRLLRTVRARFQPWDLCGGRDFHSSTNRWQAEANYQMFLAASIRLLLDGTPKPLGAVDQIHDGFAEAMTLEIDGHVGQKLGTDHTTPTLVNELLSSWLSPS